MESSISRRLGLQNEVLKWLNELSEKVQKRANQTMLDIHELMEKTDIVELDMKNTLNSFKALSFDQYVKNKVDEDDQMSGYMGVDTEKPAKDSIPAQNYEADILPRYKEALSLGLSSYQSHMEKMSRSSFVCSVFKTGLAGGLLPHIIGSEEYIHDNSCGLPDDLTLERISLDFANLFKHESISDDALNYGSDTIFSAEVFAEQPGPSNKDGAEPLVSAALDFKAMLEAALLSPYKFYDEENSSLADTVHDQHNIMEERHLDLDYSTSEAVDIDNVSKEPPSGVSDPSTFVPPGNINSFLASDVSALISGSLFDTEEDSSCLSSQDHEVLICKSENSGHQTSTVVSDKNINLDSLVEDDDLSIFPQDGGPPEGTSASTPLNSEESANEVGDCEPGVSCDGLSYHTSEEKSHLS